MSDPERLRDLIRDEKILVMPGVYDGFSSRLVAAMGYESAIITGSGLSESRLGRPDVGIMGLGENLDGTRAIVDTSGLLLLADGDTGYGNAVNVHFTVRQFESAGVAGIMLEDQASPKRCGHMLGKELISAEEMVGKVRAAVDARTNPSFIIKARTDAARPLGLQEAIRRANLYVEAGADLIFADALMSVSDIHEFAQGVPAPITVNMGFGITRRGTTPLLSAAQLQDLGVAVVEYPRLLTSAALVGMKRALVALGESLENGTVVERPDLQVSFDELNDLMGLPEILKLEERYLPAEQLATKYGQPQAQPTTSQR